MDLRALVGEAPDRPYRFRMSKEEYDAMPERPRAEWVDGEVVVTPVGTGAHSDASFDLRLTLRAALPGLRVYQDMDVALPRNRVRIPDVSALLEAEPSHTTTQVPVLVAEVLSPSTRTEDLVRKAGEYAEAGIGQYWLVDPRERTLEVPRNDADGWTTVVRLEEDARVTDVEVPGHGVVPVDVAAVLAG